MAVYTYTYQAPDCRRENIGNPTLDFAADKNLLPATLKLDADKVITGLSPAQARFIAPLLEARDEYVWVVNTGRFPLRGLSVTPHDQLSVTLQNVLRHRKHQTRYPTHSVLLFGSDTSVGIQLCQELMTTFETFCFDVRPYHFDFSELGSMASMAPLPDEIVDFRRLLSAILSESSR